MQLFRKCRICSENSKFKIQKFKKICKHFEENKSILKEFIKLYIKH